MSIAFTWLGPSAFSLNIDGYHVLIDPFLTHNPLAPISAEDVQADVILISHAHDDHLGDAVDIAKRTGAIVASNFEIGNWLEAQGVENVRHMNPGGTLDLGWLQVKWTIAHHSSSLPDGSYGGEPNGLIITGGGSKLYFAGDTSLFLDMQLIGDEGLDVAFLPIGDRFTMGIQDSIKAIELLRPRMVVPMHYNTFEAIVQDVVQWAQNVHNNTPASPIVLDPGGSHVL